MTIPSSDKTPVTRIESKSLSRAEAAILPGFSFRKHQLTRVDFSMADLVKCDFREA